MRLAINGNCTGLVKPLRADGHDVVMAVEGPGGDVEIQQKAQDDSRILITADGKSWEEPIIHRMRTGGCIVIEDTGGEGHLRQARRVLAEKKEELLAGVGFTTRDAKPEEGKDVKIRRIRQFTAPGKETRKGGGVIGPGFTGHI